MRWKVCQFFSIINSGRLGLCCASHIIPIKTVINPATLATAKALMRGEKINDSVSIAEPGKIYNRNITFQVGCTVCFILLIVNKLIIFIEK